MVLKYDLYLRCHAYRVDCDWHEKGSADPLSRLRHVNMKSIQLSVQKWDCCIQNHHHHLEKCFVRSVMSGKSSRTNRTISDRRSIITVDKNITAVHTKITQLLQEEQKHWVNFINLVDVCYQCKCCINASNTCSRWIIHLGTNIVAIIYFSQTLRPSAT